MKLDVPVTLTVEGAETLWVLHALLDRADPEGVGEERDDANALFRASAHELDELYTCISRALIAENLHDITDLVMPRTIEVEGVMLTESDLRNALKELCNDQT